MSMCLTSPRGSIGLGQRGLLLLTSDGRLAHHVTGILDIIFRKIYLVQVERVPDAAALSASKAGS